KSGFMTTSAHLSKAGQSRVVVVGQGADALELAFRLRFKLGPRANILLVPEADLGSEPHAVRAPTPPAPDQS
ncbi:MAG: hypothetical protein WEA81_02760, partial [Dehalococcoidia bacterium]